MTDAERIAQLEKALVDVTYELYLLGWAVQQVCGTEKRDRLGEFHKETAKLLTPEAVENNGK